MKTFVFNPAISASPDYTAGDNMGGLLASQPFVWSKQNWIQQVKIVDQAKNSFQIDVLFFRDAPGATTFTDNEALDVADADIGKIAAIVPVVNWFAFADNCIGIAQALAIPYWSPNVMRIALVARGAHAIDAVTDIAVFVDVAE